MGSCTAQKCPKPENPLWHVKKNGVRAAGMQGLGFGVLALSTAESDAELNSKRRFLSRVLLGIWDETTMMSSTRI